MSSQKFISDMKKLFAVCAISNFGAKICRLSIMDDGETLRTCISLELTGECLSSSAHRQ